MNYKEAINYLNTFINYEKKRTKNYNAKLYNLDKFRNLVDLFDNPHNEIKTIHVAGSKGKGSTVEYIKNILINNGLKVGTFTSPHLTDLRERIRINGRKIEKNEFTGITERVSQRIEKKDVKKRYRTFFEFLTLISFIYFKEKKVDYAVYEVGLGGRLDSTNIITPEVSIITLIDLEHTNLLGNTLKKIAYEKAGIIKESIPSVVSKQKNKTISEYFVKIAKGRKAPLFLYDRDFKVVKNNFILANGKQIGPIKIKMEGKHQLVNAVTALQATRLLNENLEIIKSLQAIKKTMIPGRIDIRVINNRTIVLDTGHTVESIKVLFETLKQKYGDFEDRDVYSIISFSTGKKIKEMLDFEKQFNTKIIFTENSSFRSATIEELQKIMKPYNSIRNLKKALDFAMEESKNNDIILLHGSFYLMTDVDRVLKKYGKKL